MEEVTQANPIGCPRDSSSFPRNSPTLDPTRQLLKASPGKRSVVAQATQNAGRSAGPSSSSGSEEEDFQSEGDHTVESSSEEIEAEACDDGSDDSHGTEEPLTSNEVGSDAGMAGEHSQEHMIRGVAFMYGPYDDIPTHIHKALVEADIEPSMVKHLTFEDCKTSMGFSLREYCILKEQVEFVLHVKKLAEASRKRTDVPMSSEAGSHKRQNVNGASSSSQGQEEPVKPVDPLKDS